jgi:tetraacyldisaccharide 4'-kinase
VSRLEQCHQGQEVIRRIRSFNPQVPVFQIFSRPTALIDLASGQERDAVSLKGQSVLAFSGVGNPASFRFFLERLGAKVVAEAIFEDHHRYTFQDIKELIRNAREEGADLLVTTEKDGVKVREFLEPNHPVWALRIDLERIEDPQAWEQFIRENVKIG